MTEPAVRTVSETDDIHTIECRIALGSPDTYRTYFSVRTDFGLDLHPDGLPVLYNHGFHPDFGLKSIGRTAPTASFRVDHDAVILQAELDKHHRYYESVVKPLIAEGKLGVSQGSAEHSIDIDTRTGEVRTWPMHEISLTPTPSNPLSTVAARSAEIISIVEAVRAEESTAEQNDLPDEDFAYIEPGGKAVDGKTEPRSLRHFPINDAAHVRNALARLSQSEFGDKARPKVEAAAAKFGIDAAERTVLGFDGSYNHDATAIRAAAGDVACASGIQASLAALMGCEDDEPDQLAMLRTAFDAVGAFIAAESAEIGTPDDEAAEAGEMASIAYMTAIRAGKRNSAADQAHVDAIHEHATALGASAHANDDDAEGSSDAETAETGNRSASDQPTLISVVREGAPSLAEIRSSLGIRADDIAAEVVRTRLG